MSSSHLHSQGHRGQDLGADRGSLGLGISASARDAHFFCAIRLVDFDPSAAKIYETLRREYRRLGKMDFRVAATVLANNGILVTRNQSDFGQTAGFSTED